MTSVTKVKNTGRTKQKHPNHKGIVRHTMTEGEMDAAKTAMEEAMFLSGVGFSELARQCEVSPQAARNWVLMGLVPPTRVLAVVLTLNGLVEATTLRPDVFGRPRKAA